MKKIFSVLFSLFIMTAVVPLISYATSPIISSNPNNVTEKFGEMQVGQVDCLTLITDSTCSVFGEGRIVTAKAGKSYDDISLEISGDPYAISNVSTNIGYTYYLVSVNFIPNYDLSAISLCSDAINDVLMIVENGWYLDKWNNVTFVYNSADCTVSCYINGSLSKNTSAASTITNNKIGIAFYTNTSSKTMYIDDYLVETYRSDPVVSTITVAPIGNIVGGNLITEDDVKVSDLKVQGANLTVFDENTYTIKKSDDELLFHNNIAVYVNDRNMYSYYNILNNNLKILGETELNATYDYDKETITISGQLKHAGNLLMILELDGAIVYTETICSDEHGVVDYTFRLGDEFSNKNYICTLSYMDYLKQVQIVNPDKFVIYDETTLPDWKGTNISSDSVRTGYLGKDYTDSCNVYTASDKISNIRFSYSGDYYRYIIAEFNYAANDLTGLDSLQIATGGNVISMNIPKTALRGNEWNHVIVVIDTVESKSIVYLNGQLTPYGTKVSGQFLTSTDLVKTEFRIRLEGNAPVTFAVDDFEMNTSASLPDIKKDYKYLQGSHIISELEVLYKSGTAAENILSDRRYKTDGATTAIYDVQSGQVVTAGELPEVAKLAIRTDDNTIKTYDLVALSGIRTWDSGNYAKNGFAFADDGIMIGVRYENGRFIELDSVSVVDGMVELTMNSTGADNEEIMFLVWDSLSGAHPIYPAAVAD